MRRSNIRPDEDYRLHEKEQHSALPTLIEPPHKAQAMQGSHDEQQVQGAAADGHIAVAQARNDCLLVAVDCAGRKKATLAAERSTLLVRLRQAINLTLLAAIHPPFSGTCRPGLDGSRPIAAGAATPDHSPAHPSAVQHPPVSTTAGTSARRAMFSSARYLRLGSRTCRVCGSGHIKWCVGEAR